MILKQIVQTMITILVWSICGCSNDASSSTSPDMQGDANVKNMDQGVNDLADTELDSSLTEVDAEINESPVPDWTTLSQLDSPQFEGVIIQPAMAFSDANTLHLAFSVLNPEIQGIYVKTYDLATANSAQPVNLLTQLQGLHNEPDICGLSDGGAVVVWSVDTQGDSGANLQIQFRAIDQNGVPVGDGPLTVVTEIDGNHWLGSVTCNDENQFVITGSRGDPDDTFGVFVQRYDHLGQSLGNATTVNTSPDGGQVYPVITFIPGEGEHRYAVAYEDRPIGRDELIRTSVRFFDGALQPTTAVFSVSADGVEATQPSISALNANNQVVVTATLDSDRVGMFRVDPQDERSRYTRGSENRLNYSSDLVGISDQPAYSFLKGSGREVKFMLGRYDFEALSLTETVIYEGWLPPYQTSMARFEGTAAMAVTERLDADRFKLNVFVFGP
jgi:hypothetical protein